MEHLSAFGGIFKDRTVLVTGSTGFKGAWMCLWLNLLGARVVGYALVPPTTPSLFDASRLQEEITQITGDVRDKKHLERVFATYKPEIVFHMAAQSLVRPSYEEPHLTYETNVMGTVNLFEAARKSASASVIINVTSDKCYENKEWEYAYRENDPLGGFDPYSSSKGCAEIVASAYYNSFFKSAGVRLASVRAGNVVGGGDWAKDRLVPDCVRSLAKGEEILIRNPGAIRPWQHVLEPVSGYLFLASKMWEGSAFDGPWNFGPSAASNVTVQRVVETVIDTWGGGAWRTLENTAEPHEAHLLKLDCTKANNRLGWRPVYGVEKALEVTAAWYKAYYEGEEMLSPSLKDIENYTEEARKERLAWALV